MRKKSKKLTSMFLVVMMAIYIFSSVTFAAEDKNDIINQIDVNAEDSESTPIETVLLDPNNLLLGDLYNYNDVPKESSLLANEVHQANKSIYSYSWTLIYTGNKTDRWIHITPWTVPNVFNIKMVGYGGSGDVLYEDTFATMGITHWFVGADVRRVYLKGVPGGAITVTDSEH